MKKCLLAVFFALISAGIASNAHALAYGAAYNNILNGNVTFNGPGVVPGSVIFNNSTSADANLVPDPPSASDSAVGAGPIDVPIQIDPNSTAPAAGKSNNDFTLEGRSGNYSYADAWIPSVQLPAPIGTFIQAIATAEGNLNTESKANSGSRNSSQNQFSYIFELGAPNTIDFQFDSHAYMEVFLDPTTIIGSKAETEIGFSVQLTDLGTGAEVFEWLPNGVAGGIVGGVENSDPFDLNKTLVQLTPGQQFYDPLTLGAAAVGTVVPGVGLPPVPPAIGAFSATTNPIPTGLYRLDFTMAVDQIITAKVDVIPEPGTMLLLGSGLLGIAGVGRRRSKK